MQAFLNWWIRYALLSAAVTASVSSLARALCLPPYWPAEFVFRCRPGALAPALAAAFREAALSATLISAFAAPTAAFLLLGVRILRHRLRGSLLQAIAAAAGGGVWVGIVRRLEPGVLDVKVGGYATLAGAAMAAAVMWLAARSS
jgi:hypothetical protein